MGKGPTITEYASRLGLRAPVAEHYKDMRKNRQAGWSLCRSVQKMYVLEIKRLADKVKPGDRESVRAGAVKLVDLYGPKIWPGHPGGPERPWLFKPGEGVNGVYERDLYWEREEDRAFIGDIMVKLVVAKVIKHHENSKAKEACRSAKECMDAEYGSWGRTQSDGPIPSLVKDHPSRSAVAPPRLSAFSEQREHKRRRMDFPSPGLFKAYLRTPGAAGPDPEEEAPASDQIGGLCSDKGSGHRSRPVRKAAPVTWGHLMTDQEPSPELAEEEVTVNLFEQYDTTPRCRTLNDQDEIQVSLYQSSARPPQAAEHSSETAIPQAQAASPPPTPGDLNTTAPISFRAHLTTSWGDERVIVSLDDSMKIQDVFAVISTRFARRLNHKTADDLRLDLDTGDYIDLIADDVAGWEVVTEWIREKAVKKTTGVVYKQDVY